VRSASTNTHITFLVISGSYDFENNKPVPRILDALNNGLSVVAQTLMMLRYWESWALWIAINIVQIAMFAGT
jgi:nicotinamide mononucleotide transporter PnuC